MFVEAEPHRRASKKLAPNLLKDNQTGMNIIIPLQAGEVVRSGIMLGNNLARQGRLAEAEMVVRETLRESIGLRDALSDMGGALRTFSNTAAALSPK